MNQPQFKSVMDLSPGDRYTHFITKVADWEEVFSIKTPDGLILFYDEKNEFHPFWPHPDYAVFHLPGCKEGCEVTKLSLSEFMNHTLPNIKARNKKIAIFPNNKNDAIIIEVDDFLFDLENEVSKYE